MRMHTAIVGFGRLGRACARAALDDDGVQLVGLVRRSSVLGDPRPAPFDELPAVAHVSELGGVHAALVCVPPEVSLGVCEELLQQGIPVIECTALHGEVFADYKARLDQVCVHRRATAVVGAGWDPGALSLFRHLFQLLTPHGHTDMTRRPGVSLHHTTLARAVPGVRDALSTELRTLGGALHRYVYVELESGADRDDVELAILGDPLFLDADTQVFVVDDLNTLEDEGKGVLVERRGEAAGTAHQLLLLEARFSEYALAAQVMLAALRVLPGHKHRAYSLFDLPPAALWGTLRGAVEKELI